MKLSLVMATVGRTTEISTFLESLKAQTNQNFELIVIDQNQDDRLLPIVQAGRQANLDIIHERLSPPNLSSARNKGIRLARYECIAFPDDDCWYEADVVKNVIDLAEKGLDGVIARWHEQEPVGKLAHELSSERWRKFRAAPASSISLFIMRRALERHGDFDSRFGVSQWYGSGEETDLVLRMLAGSGRLRYSPEVVVHHPFSPAPIGSLRQVCRNGLRRARGTGALYAKHRLHSFVIVRGFLAPVLKPLLPPTSIAKLLTGIFISFGRIQGFIRWRYCQR
ncbi:MAG: glycosyltransferase family 2 protein [Methylomonas sp.]